MNYVQEKLIYVHIPKTAGTSFSELLKSNFNAAEIYPGVFERDFRNISQFDQEKYKLFSGHMGFEEAEKIGGKMLTWLRNPLDRVISLYYYWQQLADNVLHKDNQIYQLTKLHSLEDFLELTVEEVFIEVRNTMAWQLALGSSPENRQIGGTLTEDDLYKLAVKNLNKFSFFGIIEFSEFSMKILNSKIKLPNIKNMPFSNKTSLRPKFSELSISTRRNISKFCEIDLAIYDYALMNFRRQITTT